MTLCSLRQFGADSVAAYAARTTDLFTLAYANVLNEDQLSLAVDNFVAEIADILLRGYLQHKRARRALDSQVAVRIAKASEAARLSLVVPAAASAIVNSNDTTLSALRERTLNGNSIARTSGRENRLKENSKVL